MTERKANQTEIPHYIQDFSAIDHDAMIRKMAAQVQASNISSRETVNTHIGEFREELAVKKIETNRFKQTIINIKKLGEIARYSAAAAKVGA